MISYSSLCLFSNYSSSCLIRGSIHISLLEVHDFPLKKVAIEFFRSTAFSARVLFVALFCSCNFVLSFLASELNLFFTEFSVLPGMHFAISLHLLPIDCCFFSNVISSHSVHESLFFTFFTYHLISGFTWLNHLSRHCFPCLAGPTYSTFNNRDISAQLFGPFSSIIFLSLASSSAVHGALVFLGLWLLCHLY